MKTILVGVFLFSCLILIADSAPAGEIAASGSVSSSGGGAFGIPFLTFDNGNVGVNFGGYSASAGLGGLLTGKAGQGGLHASAGTPYGQRASAGLGGVVDGNGNTGGSLYANAQSRPLN